MKNIIQDINSIKQANSNNLISSMLFGSYVSSPTKSNDIDLLFFVKNAENFIFPKHLNNEIIRVQYQFYKRNEPNMDKGFDILIVDNKNDFEFVRNYNKHCRKAI